MDREIKLRLGVVPVKRGTGFTRLEDALISKDKTLAVINNPHVTLINIDSVVPDGITTSPEQVPDITRYLKSQKVDAVFILHTDFGSEEVVAKIGKKMGLPLLLWGPRDDSPTPEGVRIRDTQCGLFASSKVLSMFGVKFTYIENCHPTDTAFIKGFDDFCRAASVVKAFRGMRILKIGDRPNSFFSVMANEAELLNNFGIEVSPLSCGRLVSGVNKLKEKDGSHKPKNDSHKPNEKSDSQMETLIASLKNKMDTSAFGDEKLKTLAAMILFIKNEMDRGNFAGASIECWSSMGDLFGILPCQLIGELTALGYPVSCEGDINGAISSVILHAADYNKSPSFFADLTVRHPQNNNAELLWHCGPFPRALIGDTPKPFMDSGGRGNWELKQGELTLTRFDSAGGQYSLFVGEAKTTDGPKSTGTYVWMEVDDWVKWERKIIEGPYIHHITAMYGKYADILREACKYISNLTVDLV
jgi:L-fucose isomerase-like protein